MNKRKKEKITPENKKLIVQAIGMFFVGIALVPVLQGLACFICILAEI